MKEFLFPVSAKVPAASALNKSFNPEPAEKLHVNLRRAFGTLLQVIVAELSVTSLPSQRLYLARSIKRIGEDVEAFIDGAFLVEWSSGVTHELSVAEARCC
jgi:hypothetical protein